MSRAVYLFHAILAIGFQAAQAAPNEINLKTWGLQWGMDKNKLNVSKCRAIYNTHETCELKETPRHFPTTDLYLLDFNPQGKLIGLRALGEKLEENAALSFLADVQQKLSRKYDGFRQEKMSPHPGDFLKCIRAARNCENFSLDIFGSNGAKLEVNIVGPNAPNYYWLSLGSPDRISKGAVEIKYVDAELSGIYNNHHKYEFNYTNKKLSDFLKVPVKADNALLPYEPQEYGIRWNMSPNELLSAGVNCNPLFLRYLICTPRNNQKGAEGTLYAYYTHKELGLISILFSYDVDDNKDAAAGEKIHKQVVENLLRRYPGAKIINKADNDYADEYTKSCAGNLCSKNTSIIGFNGKNKKAGSIDVALAVYEGWHKSNIAIKYHKGVTAEENDILTKGF